MLQSMQNQLINSLICGSKDKMKCFKWEKLRRRFDQHLLQHVIIAWVVNQGQEGLGAAFVLEAVLLVVLVVAFVQDEVLQVVQEAFDLGMGHPVASHPLEGQGVSAVVSSPVVEHLFLDLQACNWVYLSRLCRRGQHHSTDPIDHTDLGHNHHICVLMAVVDRSKDLGSMVRPGMWVPSMENLEEMSGSDRANIDPNAEMLVCLSCIA
jgi:hypothetical protein